MYHSSKTLPKFNISQKVSHLQLFLVSGHLVTTHKLVSAWFHPSFSNLELGLFYPLSLCILEYMKPYFYCNINFIKNIDIFE